MHRIFVILALKWALIFGIQYAVRKAAANAR